MKTKEELNAIKEEVEAVNEKLAELTPEEIAQVSGGRGHGVDYRGRDSAPGGLVRCFDRAVALDIDILKDGTN